MAKIFQRLLRPWTVALLRGRRLIPYMVSGGITARAILAAVAVALIVGATVFSSTPHSTTAPVAVSPVPPAPSSITVTQSPDVPLAAPVLLLPPQVVDLKPLLASVQRYQDSVQERLA